MQEPKNEEQVEQIEQTDKVEQVVVSAPRQLGKATMKKSKTFAEKEHAKQIEAVKTWSLRVLESQLKSTRISEDMKAAIEAEMKKRKKQA